MKTLVGVVMGSSSDWDTMRHATDLLDEFGIGFEAKAISAHRAPDLLFEWATGAADRGIEVLIAGAGLAAHLPGVLSAKTNLPVLGVPMEGGPLKGMDALLSIVQMPGGVPVGTLGIGKAGAKNAAILAARILGIKHPEIREAVTRFSQAQTQAVVDNHDLLPQNQPSG